MEEEWRHQTSSPSTNCEQKNAFQQRVTKHLHAHTYASTRAAPGPSALNLAGNFRRVLAALTGWEECNNTDPSPDKKTPAGGQDGTTSSKGSNSKKPTARVKFSGSKCHSTHGK